MLIYYLEVPRIDRVIWLIAANLCGMARLADVKNLDSVIHIGDEGYIVYNLSPICSTRRIECAENRRLRRIGSIQNNEPGEATCNVDPIAHNRQPPGLD